MPFAELLNVNETTNLKEIFSLDTWYVIKVFKYKPITFRCNYLKPDIMSVKITYFGI